MEERLLKFFVAVYEEQNVTRAAEKCFVSQPNISNGIKQLEEKMGKNLFRRHKRGVELTNEAHYLYPIAKRLLGELKELPDLFLKQDLTNEVTIGVADSLPQEYKLQFFKTATRLNTSVLWNVNTIGRGNEVNLLVREWKDEEDLFLPIWKENYVLCIPNGHSLLEKDDIDLVEDLKGENFIHCPPCEAHKQCISILNFSNQTVNTVGNCSTKTETLTLLMAGLGLTFLPEYFIDGWYGFETRPYNGPVYYREVGLAYSRNSLQNPAIAKMVNHFSKNELKGNKFSDLGSYKKVQTK